MWKKVIYFAVAVVMGMIFYMIIYSANLSDHKFNLVGTAIQNKDYHVVPQVFLEVPFDTESIIKTEDEDAVVEVYPAAGMVNYTYLVNGETKTYSRYERAYLFFMFETKFPMGGYVDSGNNTVNPTSIKFVGDKGVYNFYFVQNETYNVGSYIAEPKSEMEYALNAERDLTKINTDWDFVPISLSETAIKCIESVTGTISSFQVVDAMGEVKLEQNISFSFTEKFYTHEYIATTNTEMNEMLNKYYASSDSKEQKALSDDINNYLISFKENFNDKTKDTGYAISLSEELLTPGSVYWKTIAYLGLYAVLIMVFYVLLFHFKQIIGFIKGILGRNTNTKGKRKEPYIVKKDQMKPETKQIEAKKEEKTE